MLKSNREARSRNSGMKVKQRELEKRKGECGVRDLGSWGFVLPFENWDLGKILKKDFNFLY